MVPLDIDQVVRLSSDTATTTITLVTDGATETWTLDRQGYDAALVILTLGEEQDTNTTQAAGTIALQEGDTTSSYAAISGVATQAANHIANGNQCSFLVDCRARKRYLQLQFTASSTANQGDVYTSAVAILSRSQYGVTQNAAGLVDQTNSTAVVG